MKKINKNYLILCAIIMLFPISCISKSFIINSDRCISEFKKFAIQCKPVYFNSGTGIAAIPVPNKDINNCIFQIQKYSIEFEEVKEYAYLVMMKVLLERLKKVKSDYTMFSEHNNYESVVEKICLEDMGVKKYDDSRDSRIIKLGSIYSYLIKSKQINLDLLKNVIKEIRYEYQK